MYCGLATTLDINTLKPIIFISSLDVVLSYTEGCKTTWDTFGDVPHIARYTTCNSRNKTIIYQGQVPRIENNYGLVLG